jgi:IS5 family transposase
VEIAFAGNWAFERGFLANLIRDSLSYQGFGEGRDAATGKARDGREQDLFRSRLDQIIDMKHPLVALARTVDWGFLEGRFGEVYTDDPGHPPLPRD